MKADADRALGVQKVLSGNGRYSRHGMSKGEDKSPSKYTDDSNWMLSYVDVFTLLLTLFVILLTFSSPGDGEATEPEDVLEIVPEDLISTPEIMTQLPGNETGDSEEFEISSDEDMLLMEIRKQLGSFAEEGSVELSISKAGISLQLGERILFESATAELLYKGHNVLDKIVPVLLNSNHNISVQGHTDDQPIFTKQYRSNWELSAARAINVVHYLIDKGVAAERLSATSYAETQSIADNKTESGRARNRRVTILLHVVE